MIEKYLFTSESVTEGHPDKICDQISDAILDACLEQDPYSRVACETATKTGLVLLAGEITTTARLDMPKIVRKKLREIGYTKSSFGIDADTCAVLVHVDEQSSDICQGVTEKEGKEQGAGDQGLMFGYACNETDTLMPLPIHLAHRVTERLASLRKDGTIPYLGPDGKAQITVEYCNGKPSRVDAVVVSNQHEKGIEQERIRSDIVRNVIMPIVGEWMDDETKIYVNPTGSFVLGGPHADAGLTGRKIIVDTYGGMGRHGGGAFSGKDATKVDRSGAYIARYIAKNIVAADLAEKCEVQLAYAIGVAEPVSVHVNCFSTNKIPNNEIEGLVLKHFELKPGEIIENLNLRRPIFSRTATYGHFGRNHPDFTWEFTDKANILREEVMNKKEQEFAYLKSYVIEQ